MREFITYPQKAPLQTDSTQGNSDASSGQDSGEKKKSSFLLSSSQFFFLVNFRGNLKQQSHLKHKEMQKPVDTML